METSPQDKGLHELQKEILTGDHDALAIRCELLNHGSARTVGSPRSSQTAALVFWLPTVDVFRTLDWRGGVTRWEREASLTLQAVSMYHLLSP